MKALLAILLVTPQVHAEVFLEFTRHTHPDGTIHYTNVPNNQGANFLSIVNSDLTKLEEKSRRVHEHQIEKQLESKAIAAQKDLQRKLAISNKEDSLKKSIYEHAKKIVRRGIVAGEADYITDADAYTLHKKRSDMSGRQAAKHLTNEASARVGAGNIALQDNRPDYAWNHGLKLRALSYYANSKAQSIQMYRQGSELMSAATRQMNQFRTIIDEYESNNTDHWQVSDMR